MKKVFTIIICTGIFFQMCFAHKIPFAGFEKEPGTSVQAPVTIYLVQKSEKKAKKLVIDMWDAANYGLKNLSNHHKSEIDPIMPHLLQGLMPAEEVGFRFSTNSISSKSFIKITLDGYPVFTNYFVDPGDSVMMVINERSGMMTFTGPSAHKFRLQYEVKNILSESIQAEHITLPFNSEKHLESFLLTGENKEVYETVRGLFGRRTLPVIAGREELEYLKSIQPEQWVNRINSTVENYGNMLSPEDLDLVRASAISNYYQIYLGRLSSGYQRAMVINDPEIADAFKEFVQRELDRLPMKMIEKEVLNSPQARNFLIAKINLLAVLNNSDFWHEALHGYPGEIGERIAVQYLIDRRRRISDFDNVLASVKNRVKSPPLRVELDVMGDRFGNGSEILPFDFITKDGRRLETEEYSGKILLIDFWISGCSACKVFHEKVLGPVSGEFKDSNKVAFISVCSDLRSDNWIKKSTQLDKDGENTITEVYAERNSGSNPFLDYYNIHSYPQLMIIGSDGKLHNIGSPPRSGEELKMQISEILND